MKKPSIFSVGDAFQLRLTLTEREILTRLSDDLGMSRAAVLRRALREFHERTRDLAEAEGSQ